MDAEEDQVRYAPAEDLDLTENDWLEEMSRDEFGGMPYDPALDRTTRDLMELRGISQKTAAMWMDKEVKAGRLTRREIILNGKRTTVYRPVNPRQDAQK